MSKQLITEDQVKDALGLESFRNITKNKIMEFVSLIPNMDKEVAKVIINQFPAFASAATTMVVQLKEMCDSVLNSNKESQNAAIEAYKKVLDDLGELLKKDELSPEERENIIEHMVTIADKISLKDTENKEFLNHVLNGLKWFSGMVIVVGAAILGVKIKDTKIPSLRK